MTTNDNLEYGLSFYGNDPGAVKHGNFINYYTFHDVNERINSLNPRMFPKPINDRIICLDIGCNTGELTKAIYEYLKTFVYTTCIIHILAVDIDPTLIERAKESNENPNITFKIANIMSENNRIFIQDYLETFNTTSFDVTFCFSITMWIHLNNGDEGLIDFLKYIKSISRTIVMEPQPWKCYRNAQRRVKKSGKSFQLYESLKIKANVDIVIENYLSDGSHNKIYESPHSSWNRKLQSFQAINRF